MSTTEKLPGANFNAPITNDDLTLDQTANQTEHLERTKLNFGHPDWITDSSYGIVSNTDPSNDEEASTNPLVVTGASNLTISVNGGYAVTESGFRLSLTSTQAGIALSSTDINAINIVTLKYSTANGDTQSINEYSRACYKFRYEKNDETLVEVYTLSEWNDLTLDQQKDHVVIGAVTVQIGTSGSKELLVDLTNVNYSFNRPWFSSVDVKHRSYVGSGTVSNTNPHGMAFSDLNEGGFTLPQLISRCGAIVSQPQHQAHVPGIVCETEIASSSIKKDGYGYTYFEMPFYPVRLGKVVNAADETKEFAFYLKPRTNLVYQALGVDSTLVPTTQNLKVYSSRVETLEPPTLLTPTIPFSTGEIKEKNLVLAGGVTYNYQSDVSLTDAMSDAGPIPMHYDFYFQGGNIVKNPQVLLCRTKLTDMASGAIPTATQFGCGVILVALDKATSGSTLSVKVKIDGTDEDGVEINETLTFNNSNWSQGAAVPSPTIPVYQLQRGTKYFFTITNITITENIASGDDAAIQVWVVMNPTYTEELSYACPIAETVWDGVKFCTCYDTRNIVTDLQQQEPMDAVMGVAMAGINPSIGHEEIPDRRVIVAENFRNPSYGCLVDPTWSVWRQLFGQNRVAPTDGSHFGLWGFYQSRALPHLGTESDLKIILLPLSSQLIRDRERHFYPDANAPSIYISEQTDVSTWSSWYTVNTRDSYDNSWYFTPSPNSAAFRIRIVNGYDFWGMVITQDKAVVMF